MTEWDFDGFVAFDNDTFGCIFGDEWSWVGVMRGICAHPVHILIVYSTQPIWAYGIMAIF